MEAEKEQASMLEEVKSVNEVGNTHKKLQKILTVLVNGVMFRLKCVIFLVLGSHTEELKNG